MLGLERDSTRKEENTTHTFTHTPTVRNGFRRKKGDSPLVYNLNLKVKKRENNPTLLTLIHGLEL